MSDFPVWDIASRKPVELPVECDPLDGEELLRSSKFRQDIELDRYECAVMAMPIDARVRFLRSMATADVIKSIFIHGRRAGLTQPK